LKSAYQNDSKHKNFFNKNKILIFEEREAPNGALNLKSSSFKVVSCFWGFAINFLKFIVFFLEGENLYMKKLRTFDDYIISLSFQPKIYSRKERTRRIGKNYT